MYNASLVHLYTCTPDISQPLQVPDYAIYAKYFAFMNKMPMISRYGLF